MNEEHVMVKDPIYRFDHISDGKILHQKKKGHLPAMGWNSWNAFGSGNTEKLTKEMADAFEKLELDKVGYQYIVLDDGCYKPERIDGKLANDEVKFPSGFRALADYIHEKGLKFGMYNDIGVRLCAGAWVGTCGHEKTDAETYLNWCVDFLKVDNCYYLWDNATFADPTNAKYVYTPNIRGISIKGNDVNLEYSAVKDGILTGTRAEKTDSYVTKIGTFDGTGPDFSPVGVQSSELHFCVNVPESGEYELRLTYATGEEEGVGGWLQLAVGEGTDLIYDDFLPATDGTEVFTVSDPISISLNAGENLLRIMNHRRQENTLGSYGTLVKELNALDPDKDMILSICEWGKTQPQNWGYKVGDSWRILNDITFQVGADGDPGQASWTSDYTNGLMPQYNKAVIMDEFSGLEKGWNDPDMMMIGMNGMTEIMNKTHMTMWCMMNSPLMLGLDLRRVEKGDALWKIIANQDVIALNQDSLGIQAKRIFCSCTDEAPDQTYVKDGNRVDILAKPLADGSVALSFINVSEEKKDEIFAVTVDEIVAALREKMIHAEAFAESEAYEVMDLWSKEKYSVEGKKFEVSSLEAYDNITIRVTPNV